MLLTFAKRLMIAGTTCLTLQQSYSQNGSPMAVTSSADNRFEVFVETNKGIQHFWSTNPVDYFGWEFNESFYLPAPDMADISNSDPRSFNYRQTIVAAIDGTGRLMAAWIVKGKVYFVSAPTPGGSLNEPGQYIYDTENIWSLAIARNQDGRLELFTVGRDGVVSSYTQQQAGNWSWSGRQVWSSQGLHEVFKSIYVTPYYDGRLIAVGVDMDRNRNKRIIGLSQSEPNSSAQIQTFNFEGNDIESVIAAESIDHRLEIFARGGDHLTYHRYQAEAGELMNPVNMTAWTLLSTLKTMGPIQIAIGNDGRMEIIEQWVLYKYAIFHIYQHEANGAWDEFTKMSGLSTNGGSVLTVRKPGGDLALFAFCRNGLKHFDVKVTIQVESARYQPPLWSDVKLVRTVQTEY